MFLFLAIAFGLFAVYHIYLSRPLRRGSFSAEDWAQLEDESTALLGHDRLIEELRDIEFEAALNKVDGQDLAFCGRATGRGSQRYGRFGNRSQRV